jgi:hypothetical protein
VWTNVGFFRAASFRNSFFMASNPVAFPHFRLLIALTTSSCDIFITEPANGLLYVMILLCSGPGNFAMAIALCSSTDGYWRCISSLSSLCLASLLQNVKALPI